jgi:hypothetical protein
MAGFKISWFWSSTNHTTFKWNNRMFENDHFQNCVYFWWSGELLSPLSIRRLSSVVRPLTFHILINSSEATGPIWTKLWWNGPWMAPFQICVRCSRFPSKMATKLKIEKRGDEILIVHCCFSISQNAATWQGVV